MSFSGGRSLLGPLLGKTATFLVDGRLANAKFARSLTNSFSESNISCVIFDLDAFYSSNADLVFAGLGGGAASITVKIPAPGTDIEAAFSSLFRSRQRGVVIDSLNTLYHLISMEDGASRGRKLMFALAGLSQFARANGTAVILTMYRREGFAKQGKGRSISGLSDVTASVSIRGDDVEVRTERGTAWPGGAISSRIP